PLAPATVDWATQILRGPLRGHHECLLQHLRESRQENLTRACSSTLLPEQPPESPTNHVASQSCQGLLAYALSGTVSPEAVPQTASATQCPTRSCVEPASASVVPLHPASGQPIAEAPFLGELDLEPLTHASESPAPLNSPYNDAPEEHGVAKESTHGDASWAEETDSLNGGIAMCQKKRPTSGHNVAPFVAVEHSKPGIVSGDGRRGPVDAPPIQPSQRQADNCALQCHPELEPQAERPKTFAPPSRHCKKHDASVRIPTSAHVRAYWALQRCHGSPAGAVDSLPVLPRSVPAAQAPNFPSLGVRATNLQQLFGVVGEWQKKDSTVEPRTAFSPPLRSRSYAPAEESQPPTQCKTFQPGTPIPLQHPHSPCSSSLEGSPMTTSLCTITIPEKASGTPLACTWQSAPACRCSPNWGSPTCCTYSRPQWESLSGTPKSEIRACQPNEESAKPLDRQSELGATPTPKLAPKSSVGGPSFTAGSEVRGIESSIAKLRLAGPRIPLQKSSQFLLPVTPEPSPSVSIYSARESSSSGSALLFSDNPDDESGSVLCGVMSGTQQPEIASRPQDADTAGSHDGTSPVYLSPLVDITQRHRGDTGRLIVASQASRTVESRMLKRVVRSLCSSVSGTNSCSEQRLLEKCDSVSQPTRSKRFNKYYSRTQRQNAEPLQRESEKSHCVGFRRRVSRRLLPHRYPSVATPPCTAAGIPKPATRRRYRRMLHYRRRTGADPGSRFTVPENTGPTSNSGCEVYMDDTGTARKSGSLSEMRGSESA
ncbi:uncharacterized protein LOC113146530, partial [Cyclospora cayetanensis]|uniref:Uncharacterized protein LOC113146530 n=1 Tax=Cyclospora cayetanensis TaxID=88456 RepID=A0A6P6RQ86_9EIME